MTTALALGLSAATLEKLNSVFARHSAINADLIAPIDRVGVEIYTQDPKRNTAENRAPVK